MAEADRPEFLTARVPRHRTRREGPATPAPPPPPPPPVGVVVLEVLVVDGVHVDFVFDAPVSCDGAGSGQPVIELSAGVTVAPLACQQVSSGTVRYLFDAPSEIVAGMGWRIEGAISSLGLPAGRVLAVPQAGIVAGG